MELPSFLITLLLFASPGILRSMQSRAHVIDGNLRKLAEANNYLAVNIYRQLTTGQNGNVIFSPLSLSSAFGMLYYGARGDTAQELRTALGYERAGLGEGMVHEDFKKYLTEFLPSRNTSDYNITVANAVFVDEELNLVPAYKTGVEDFYQATVRSVDFAIQQAQIISEINQWVSEKTHGKINHFLDHLDPSSLLVLLNAVYFKGTWKSKFDPRHTTPSTFFNNGLLSSIKETATMHTVQELPYAQVDGARVLEMPYRGDNVSMLLLLPDELDGLQSLERILTPTKLSELRSQLTETNVHLSLPKFKLQYSRELSGVFQSAGINKIFHPTSDFSGITSSNLAVGEVLHKAVIEVNEGGSEAGAATAIVISETIGSPTVSFTVDRPFLFAIVDRRNDMILFLGRVTKF